MITEPELKKLGFTEDEIANGIFHDNEDITIFMQSGVITFVTHGDNYHGLNVKISSITEWEEFSKFIHTTNPYSQVSPP